MTTLTVCGSAKYKPLIHKVCNLLIEKGFIVLVPPLYDMTFINNLSSEQGLLAWKGATYAHFQRIATSDAVIMINPSGYLGVSSSLELGYAVANSKLIIALNHDLEPAREGLFDIVLGEEEPTKIVDKVTKLMSR